MTTKTKSTIAFLVLAICAASVQADEAQSTFKFSGFGTLGAVHSSLDTADFTAGIRPNGAGATRNLSWNVDSRLGAQLDARIGNKLSAVVQLIAEQRWDNSMVPTVEWANVQYEVTPEFRVRVGRIALPTYLLSDSRKVGFANMAVRPPEAIYKILPITNSDGVDMSYRLSSGELLNTTTVYVGQNTIKLATGALKGVKAKATEVHGIVNNTEYGAATFHVAYHEQKLTIKPTLNKSPLKVFTMGVQYDPGTWLAIAEVVQDKLSGKDNRRAGYAMVGYHIGEFTPYAGYTRVLQLNPMRSNQEQTVGTLGVRWNLVKNADLKLQYEHIRLGQGADGGLVTTREFQPGSNFRLLSAVVDFVY